LFPRNRPDLPDLRRQREEASRAFLARHRRYLWLACRLPFVRMVALSGSVAHLNLDKGGDLDLFVVTRGRHAWSVTVALVVLAKLMRRRRVVCANFVMADTRLGFEPQDLFTASQLIHLRPLIGGDMHQSLLAANPFVYRFYPNAHVPSAAGPPGDARAVSRRIVEALLAAPARLLEHVCRIGYRRYLHARSGQWTSPEQVCLDDDRLKLHTRSHRQSVLDRFDYLVREAIGGQARPAEGGQGQTAAISARTPALVPAPEVLGRVRSRAEQPA
jgi:hypothetical protein